MTVSYDTHSRFFQYREAGLFVEDVCVKEIAEAYGTPAYVYSKNAVLDAFQSYKRGLEGIPHIVAYAVKANGNHAILQTLAQAGAGADLTSGGELMMALRAGIPAQRMVFSGVGKTETEIQMALDANILMFNVESEPELLLLSRMASTSNTSVPISLRVNPDIDAKTHPKISTGLKEHKFGIPLESAMDIYQNAAQMENVEIRGISSHIGSSLPDSQPILDALERLLKLRDQLSQKGINIPYLDLGGGLGIRYENESPDSPESFAHKIKQRIESIGATLILEPGRSIVGNAGLLLCRIVYVKRTPHRTFVVVDAAMNDLARPAIYGAYHNIIPVGGDHQPEETVDVVGPICESSDVFGKQRVLPECQEGDLLAVCSAGAYGFAMASRYNGRIMPAEAIVDGSEHRLVRRRESYDDLFTHQIME